MLSHPADSARPAAAVLECLAQHVLLVRVLADSRDDERRQSRWRNHSKMVGEVGNDCLQQL